MPMALSKRSRFEVVLASDEGRPEAQRPTFVYRYLTGDEWLAVCELRDGLEQAGDAREGSAAIYEAACTGLVGWKHMVDERCEPPREIPFAAGAEALRAIVGPVEACELIARIVNTRITAEDKKKSDSPSASSTEPSAVSAAASNSAATSPAS